MQPTAGVVSIKVLMSAAHQLSISSVKQYQVNLDASARMALASITPPTISGDSYWYDQGTSVSLILNGVWNRSSGVGERLVSFTVNGASNAVSTGNSVDALAPASISSPESVSAVITTQYQLSTSSGSVESATSTPISGDTGWYRRRDVRHPHVQLLLELEFRPVKGQRDRLRDRPERIHFTEAGGRRNL